LAAGARARAERLRQALATRRPELQRLAARLAELQA